MPPLDVVGRFQAAVAAGRHGGDLRVFFTEDATVIEHPNTLKPRGAVMALEEMLAGSSVGAKLLQWQRFDVQQAVEHGNEVIIRVTWTGKVAVAAGSFEAGQELRAHLAQFIRTRQGRIQQIETYDCFEPLA